MAVRLVLNGGIKTCCSVTPTEIVAKSLREWLPDDVELIVIDKAKDEWRPDSLVLVARECSRDDIFPLVYIGDALAMVGGIPSRKTLLAMINGEMDFGIEKDELLDVARRRHESEAAPEEAMVLAQ